MTRRRALRSTLVAGAWLAGCRAQADDLAGRCDKALTTAMRALIAAQAPDGAWRSRTYGALKDGPSLTPTVLKAVVFGPTVEGSEAARLRGAAYLVRLVQPDGSIDGGRYGLIYPVYLASEAAIVLGRVSVEGAARARAAWVQHLLARQLTGPFGWVPTDPAFGGWGDGPVPSIPGEGRPADADLSSTLFAVGALCLAGVGVDDPAIRAARCFVERCQNWPEAGRDPAPEFDDGGFFFSPTDLMRNKAGVAGRDRVGRTRFHSYGSMTADGVRALLRCGMPPDAPRVLAARGWLERNASALTNPGTFDPARAVERESTFYYYAWSFAHASRSLGLRGGGRAGWARSLLEELLRRQRPDGTWSNPFTASKEDDPLIATSLATAVLALGRLGWE